VCKKERVMNKLKERRRAGAFGIVACVLLIVAFPLYYSFIHNFVLRLRNASKTSTRSLSLKDKVVLSLSYELDKRLGGLGVGLYRLTGGRIARFYKANVLILTTHGRRSGKTRTVLLQFFQDGENLVIVTANSGRSSHPGWFYNLKATPTAKVQVMDRILQVRAEEMPADEAAAFWPRILRFAPSYARYQKATSRTIPLVRLVPIKQARELTLPGDEALLAERNYLSQNKALCAEKEVSYE
jgi:F420H(2)-dependent quinone reductase